MEIDIKYILILFFQKSYLVPSKNGGFIGELPLATILFQEFTQASKPSKEQSLSNINCYILEGG